MLGQEQDSADVTSNIDTTLRDGATQCSSRDDVSQSSQNSSREVALLQHLAHQQQMQHQLMQQIVNQNSLIPQQLQAQQALVQQQLAATQQQLITNQQQWLSHERPESRLTTPGRRSDTSSHLVPPLALGRGKAIQRPRSPEDDSVFSESSTATASVQEMRMKHEQLKDALISTLGRSAVPSASPPTLSPGPAAAWPRMSAPPKEASATGYSSVASASMAARTTALGASAVGTVTDDEASATASLRSVQASIESLQRLQDRLTPAASTTTSVRTSPRGSAPTTWR